MITDVDTALKQIADWYINNRREMTEPELESILMKHCGTEAEMQKFVKFLETEPGQLRFKTLLRESKAEERSARSTSKLMGDFIIRRDRMGNIIITYTLDIGKSVFLQSEADREVVYGILTKEERENLDEGWRIEIRDDEPRASILEELWEGAENVERESSNPTEATPKIDNKSRILECFHQHKLKWLPQALISDVWRCSGLPKQEFIDTIWEMAQKDFIFDIIRGYSPHFIGAPKRGVLAWTKDQRELAEMIRAKVPEKQLLSFGYPRYLLLRSK